MDYLGLAVKLRNEVGDPGSDTTTLNASGTWGRLCMWIDDAWSDIQQSHENQWRFMRNGFSFDATPFVGAYTPAQAGIADFAKWRLGTVRAYLKSQGIGDEQYLSVMSYDDFRNLYLYNTSRTTYSRPIEVSQTPDQKLIVGLAPDDVYVISGDYQRSVQSLTQDADIPTMPERFHRMIVYKAMMSYGAFEAANEVYERGKSQYLTMMSKLKINQLPSIQRGGSLI